MPLGGLQHYTIEPQDLEKTKDFYVDVLGLENGDRPPLGFAGLPMPSYDRAPARPSHLARFLGRPASDAVSRQSR